ncbi:MAG: hypothetical protein HETSPECPRED_007202 [Heterodermia speciosa]|uniref:Polyketide synthase n=1 Tax=Heterodermia speciosa TaxID=116794 RepID=A0A8H3EJ40_9LECA|nr:MAG: hypothetical protein HETSPECPRED_007202 [Heterodermia speciosa]
MSDQLPPSAVVGELRILLFGDQSSDTRSYLRNQLLTGRTNPLLCLFFDRVTLALRQEISELSPLERRHIPTFSSIDELADRSRPQVKTHPGIDSALLCISQLAHYFEYAGDRFGQPGEAARTVTVGLCTGLLAAAAVAFSPALPALVPLGVEVTLIAFRTGLCVGTAARSLELSQDRAASWSFIVTGTDDKEAQAILSSFHREKKVPKSKHAYISAVSKNAVTISGPPTVLKKLFDFAAIGTHRLPIPVHGPYHAPHLYSGVDCKKILGTSNSRVSSVLNQYAPRLPIMSTSSGKWFSDKMTTTQILTSVINDILNEPLRFYEVLNGCTQTVAASSFPKCRIIACGQTTTDSTLSAALRSGTNVEVALNQDDLLPSSTLRLNQRPRNSKKPKLAIVGMAGRFPNAADHEKFWELLYAGLDVHREVPKDRFDVRKHYDANGKVRNTSHTPYGCFIDEPGLFDPRFFNMSPREATQTDPMHRLGLTSAYEALEMAGYVPNRTPSTKLDRIGTFYGQTSDDWREINAAQDIDTYFITGGVRAFAPGRINYHFKFSGPSFSVDTACSSSMAAIQLACTSLWAGDCDTAVAGGLNVMTNSDIFAGLSRGQFLSKTGNCQTYDNDADGYCRGDGIGTIILKRLEDAEADNDRILGVILETATNHSANAISITHPHAATQEDLFQKVMDDAGVDPHDVSYVEMHGTGTQAGDGTEMKSVTNVFAPPSRKGTRTQPLHLGTVKSNVGHGEAVSGVTAMIKCLLMMQKNLIPPHCGIKKTINQGFPQDLMARNVHIAFKPTPLVSRDGSPRKIFVNNFSAAGGNTALLLEDAPTKSPLRDDPRSNWVVSVCAKSKSALRKNAERLIQYIDNHPQLRIADLSYTTTARRIQHNYRITFNCDSVVKAREILLSKLDVNIDPVSSVQPSVALVYTGQGSHYTALGKQLFETSSQFRADILNFNHIACAQGFQPFLSLLEGDIEAKDLSPVAVQVGICSIQMALTALWASWGLKPAVVMGHSLGEYAALNAAGVLSTSDTIYLVGERAKLLEEKCLAGSHAMIATKASVQTVMDIVRPIQGVSVACINGPQETVLSGTVSDVDQAIDKLAAHGVKCTKLNVPYAFHSSQVDAILADFESIASHVTLNKPSVPVISPLLASVMSEADTIDAKYLCRHAREAVNFSGALVAAQELGLVNVETIWVEIGPHPVCLSFVKTELGQNITTAPSLRKDAAPYKTIAGSLASLHTAGLVIDWNEYHRDFLDCVQMLDLPAYAFDNKTYWIQYTGDWNLTKGQVVGNLAILPEAVTPSISTTSVQKVISESAEKDKASMVIESDISRPDLYAAISGHSVNGTALCPSSLYGDMALTVCNYLYKLLRPGVESVGMNVCHMEVFKPFIAKEGGQGQTLRLSTNVDLTVNRAVLVFSSGSNKTEVQHAKCHVEFGSESAWLDEWQRTAYLIRGRIEGLIESASTGKAHRMLRGMAYKLFGALVDYDPKYRGMSEAILDSPQLEATSHVEFQTTEADGNFFCSPYWIDSVAHLAGFVVNANDALDSTKQVYISHGWESMRFAEPLSASKSYRSYVKMQPAGANMMAGDVFILDGDRIVGMVGALKFQCIPRQLLNTFLPPKGAAAAAAVPQKAAIATQRLAPKLAAAPKPVVKVTALPKTGPSVTIRTLDIIAGEVGMPQGELADAIDFTDIGVDSLMSLSITGRIREELEIDVPSSLFTDQTTVGALKRFMSRYDSSDSLEVLVEDSTGTTTPYLDSDGSSTQSEPLSTPTSPGSPGESEDLQAIIRGVVSLEMGLEVSELLAAGDLTSIGMDSLMALTILGELREKTGLSLPADFLTENNSLKAIEKTLHVGPVKPAPTKVLPIAQAVQVQVPATVSIPINKPVRHATSVLLQGMPKSATKTLWLVPDGSGSATSYIFMPDIGKEVAVYGLNSPFMKTPEEYDCGVVGMATYFIQEIKRRQPHGPYRIGGWSAGGVISYETVRQLIEAGDEVDLLVLIDTPCPLIIEPLPSSLHRWFGSIGLLGEGDGALDKLPPWLLPHFAASVTALSTYDTKMIPPGKTPKVFAIWCEDGVCKYPEDPRPDPYPYGHAQWLLENRTDFGPNLWDTYLDKDKIFTRSMTGNHFSMMRAPLVAKLSDFLREALT